MSRILFAWELGGNYGHISIILLIARQLRRRGHDILFAVKSLAQVKQLLEDDGFCYVKSPCLSSRQTRCRTPVSYADILIGAGFGSRETLAELVWQSSLTVPHIEKEQGAWQKSMLPMTNGK